MPAEQNGAAPAQERREWSRHSASALTLVFWQWGLNEPLRIPFLLASEILRTWAPKRMCSSRPLQRLERHGDRLSWHPPFRLIDGPQVVVDPNLSANSLYSSAMRSNSGRVSTFPAQKLERPVGQVR